MKNILKLFLGLILALPAVAQNLTQIQTSLFIPAGSSLQGVAGTATAITCTVDAIDQLNSQQFPKHIRVQLPTSAGAIYTPGSGFTGLVSSINCNNPTGSGVSGVEFFEGGTANVNAIYGPVSIDSHGLLSYVTGGGWSALDSNSAKKIVGSTSLTAGVGINISSGAINLNVPVTSANGGTGADLSAAGSGKYPKANGSGAFAASTLAAAGTGTCTNQFARALNGDAAPTCATVALGTDVNGTLLAAQMPAIGGEITCNAGTTTCTVNEGVIDYADLVNQVGTSVIGRSANSTGVAAAIQAGADNTILARLSGALSFATGAAITAILSVVTTTTQGVMSALMYLHLLNTGLDVVADYGAFADRQTYSDCSIGAGSATLTCATSVPFVSTDCQGGTGCTGTNGNKKVIIPTCAASSAQLSTTILGFTSSSVVTLAASCTSAITANTTEISFGHDDTTPVTNAINAQQAGAYSGLSCVYLSKGVTGSYMITSALPTITKHFCMYGTGAPANADAGNYAEVGGSNLAWNGASNVAAMLAFAPTTGASNSALVGSELHDFWIDCRNGDQWQCLDGISIQSVHGNQFSNIMVVDPLIGIDSYVVSTLGEARDMTRGVWQNIKVRMADANKLTLYASTTSGTGTFGTGSQSFAVTSGTNANTPGSFWIESNIGQPILVTCTGGGGTTTLTGCTSRAQDVANSPTWIATGNIVQSSPSNGPAWLLSGDSTANSCCFSILGGSVLQGSTWGPAAMEMENADSIEVFNMIINGGSHTNDGNINRIRKPGVRFGGSNTNASFTSRNNHFYGGSAGAGGVSNLGLLNGGATLLAFPALPNYWEGYQMGNGEPAPDRETLVGGNGAILTSWQNGAMFSGPNGPVTVGAQAIPAATATYINGSSIEATPQGWQVGMALEWDIDLTSVNLGTAANTIIFKIGALGTTGDASIGTCTTGVGTAAAGQARLRLHATVTAVGAAASMLTECEVLNNGATGFTNAAFQFLPTTSTATFNSGTANLVAGIVLTTGATKTATITDVQRYVRHSGL